MNIFKRIRNAFCDFRLNIQYPGIQDASDRLENELKQENLKMLIEEQKARKQKYSHLLKDIADLKTESLKRGW